MRNDLLVQSVLLVQSTKCRVPFSVNALLVKVLIWLKMPFLVYSSLLVQSSLLKQSAFFNGKCTFLLGTENKTMQRHYKRDIATS